MSGGGGQALRFAADVMAGRLAKWLRILGFDTLYHPDLRGPELAVRARAEGRLLLTRDTALAAGAPEGVLCLPTERTDGQLAFLADRFDLEGAARPFTRCIRCNSSLVPIEPEEARGAVPPYVFNTRRRFRRCADCGRIYWSGTHRAKMIAYLRQAGILIAETEDAEP